MSKKIGDLRCGSQILEKATFAFWVYRRKFGNKKAYALLAKHGCEIHTHLRYKTNTQIYNFMIEICDAVSGRGEHMAALLSAKRRGFARGARIMVSDWDRSITRELATWN